MNGRNNEGQKGEVGQKGAKGQELLDGRIYKEL